MIRMIASPSRKLGLLLAVVGLLALSSFVSAEEFDRAKFDKARADGKSIILDFHAVWCGTCKKQLPIVQSLLLEPEFKDFQFFNVDYDWSEELNKEFNVQRQATIIVFKGKEERDRSIGVSDREDLKAQFLKAK